MDDELASKVYRAFSDIDRSRLDVNGIPIKLVAANIVANRWTDTFADFMGLEEGVEEEEEEEEEEEFE